MLPSPLCDAFCWETGDGRGAQFAFDFAGVRTASDVPVGRPTSVDWVSSIEVGKCHENVRAFGDGSFGDEILWCPCILVDPRGTSCLKSSH